jgi:hypothetical protein
MKMNKREMKDVPRWDLVVEPYFSPILSWRQPMTDPIRPQEETRNWTVDKRMRRFTIYKKEHAYEDVLAASWRDPEEENDH